MSLKPRSFDPVPELTAATAWAAFPKGNSYLTLRDELGTLYCDEHFSKLFPTRGKPALSPWRLALVTIMQFRENFSDRMAADAVRSRIDWKYLLGLDLTDPGFNFSVLCEFRARLIAGNAELQLLDTLLERCATSGLLNRQGRQRTDSTHVLASIRTLSRLELIGETLRAALNEIAATEPAWLQEVAPTRWHECYDRRIENSRLPNTSKGRDTYVQTTGEDGATLLALVDSPTAPARLNSLLSVTALQSAWARNFEIDEVGAVRFRSAQEAASGHEQIESPYDSEARFRSKSGMSWTGYMAHFS